MTNSPYNQGGHECPPSTDNPAQQPHPPGDRTTCKPIPQTTPPKWEKPEPCKKPNLHCECPDAPSAEADCLQDLITAKAKEIAKAEKAKAFKAELEALLGKAKAAKQDYTREKYEKLRKQWVEQDEAIYHLIRKLVCALPCWDCVIDCYICPLLNRMHDAEERLKWDPTKYPDAYNHYDMLHWHLRDKGVKERRFNRIKSVMAAWEKPAQTIEKILADNAKLIADAGKAIGTDAPKVIFDVFLHLVPLHLAIAPPQGSKWTTLIDKKYTKFCCCDTEGENDDCCGPDVGKTEWSLRERFIGPQPYLIDPNDYLNIICCLVDKRYGPAQQDLADADAKVLEIESEIKRDKALIEDGLKLFEKDAKGAIPSVIDCCDFKPGKENTREQSARAY